MRAALSLGCAACCLLFATHPAAAARPIGLPHGEQVQQLEWTASGQLLVLTSSASGFAVRLADPASGELSVVAAPRTLLDLDATTQVQLSPAGNGIAALTPGRRATEPGRLRLYRMERGGLAETSLRKLDASFFPGLMSWRSDGSELYVSAAPYVGAEGEDSIIAVKLANGATASKAKKADVDLISELAYIPKRDVLAVKCGGLQGDYPDDLAVALVGLKSTGISVLHTEAREFTLAALPDSTLMLNAPRSAKERWVLLPGQDTLRRSEQSLQVTAWTSSPDGRWLGGIVDGRAVKREAGVDYGIIRSRDGKHGILTARPCRAVRIAPGGKSAAVVSADGALVSIIEIPELQSE